MKWTLLALFFITSAHAFNNPYFARSPRGMLMGDAFTAVNDDDFTLFYNPASLARHKRDFTFYPFNLSLSGTNVLNDIERFSNMPSEPVGAADVLMDYPVHASAGVAPGLKLFNVGLTYLVNDSYDALLRNKTHPMLDLDMRSDRGVIFGVGLPIGPNRLNKRSSFGTQTSIGASAKYIQRTGLRDSLALTGTTVIDSLGQGEFEDILNSLGRVKGTGWGFDAGVEHIVRDSNSQIIVGLSALDITGTDFSISDNPQNLKVANNPFQFNFGIAGGQNLKLFHYVLSADVRALNENMAFGKRLRLGAQVGIPGLEILAGMNSGYYSYGAMVNLGFLKLTTGFYDIEIGSSYKQTKSRRFVVYLSLFDFSFDA